MVMKRNKLILGIFIGVLFICAVVLGAINLINREDSVPVTNDGNETVITEESIPETNGGDEMILPEEEVTPLTEEQYQQLKDSIRPESFDYMNSIMRRNAWLLLDTMAEVEFVENRNPGESAVSGASWILEQLGVGEIEKLTVVDIWHQNIDDLAAVLIIRIVNSEDRTYYLQYNQTWGLGVVRKDSEDGELIYSIATHFIVDDGRICGLEHSGSAICKIE